MIEDETKRYKPTKNYLDHLDDVKLHEFEVSYITHDIYVISYSTFHKNFILIIDRTYEE